MPPKRKVPRTSGRNGRLVKNARVRPPKAGRPALHAVYKIWWSESTWCCRKWQPESRRLSICCSS